MSKKLAYFTIFFLLSGCASVNIPLPKFSCKSTPDVAIKSMAIIDRTSKSAELKRSALGDYQVEIKQETPFSKVLSDDLNKFFNKSDTSLYSVSVQIQRADPYWTLTAEQRVPLLGMLAMGMEVEYGIYLKLQFEVEQNNKVVRVYLYDNVIKTTAQNATGEDMEKGYQKLISVYREEFFQQLDHEFVERYF
jgi:hypothetical protein